MTESKSASAPFDREIDRRKFVQIAAAAATAGTANWLSHGQALADDKERPARLLFTSQGRTGIVNVDGSELRYFDFDVPNQATWQPALVFPDGQRIIFLSMEPRRDGPGKPFDEYYTQTPTHLWLHDLRDNSLTELCTKDRLAPFTTPALLLSEERMLVQVVRNRVGQIFSVRLDGSDPREFTKAGEGLPYGISLSPDAKRVAFHLASPEGYQVWTSDADGGNRARVAAHGDHLYFGPTWSPDGQWLAYYDCLYKQDPAHDWADVCVGRPDGSEHRVLTTGQAGWFGATYGSPKTKGGGSNIPAWTRDGRVLFPRRLAGSKVPWEHQNARPDVDHFNRDFKPELARGGTQIVAIDPREGREQVLSTSQPQAWDFRSSQSVDGKHLVFCRAATGGAPAIFVADAHGGSPREITRGRDELGADHPRWL